MSEIGYLTGMAATSGLTFEQVATIAFSNLTTIILAAGLVLSCLLITVYIIKHKMKVEQK